MGGRSCLDFNKHGPEEAVDCLCEGNEDVRGLLGNLYDRGDAVFLQVSEILVDMNIRGEQIWTVYDQCCDQNIDMFFQRILERDPSIVHYLKQTMTSSQILVHGVPTTEGWTPDG